jgi:peptidyl-prolyl cis-trans isomerase SurA
MRRARKPDAQWATLPAVRALAPLLLLWPVFASAQARVADRIVATVNLHAITRGALEERLKPLLTQHLAPADRANAEQETLEAMIDDLLIADDAERLGLRTPDDEVDSALKEVAERNALTVDQLLEAARAQGLEPAAYREEIRRQLTEMRWVQLKSSPTRPDGGVEELGRWLASERARLVAQLRADAVIEVRR